MAYEVIMGLSASYAIVFVGTFTECPYIACLRACYGFCIAANSVDWYDAMCFNR